MKRNSSFEATMTLADGGFPYTFAYIDFSPYFRYIWAIAALTGIFEHTVFYT